MKTYLILITFLFSSGLFATTDTKVFINIFKCEDKSIIKVTEFAKNNRSWTNYKVVKKGKSGIIEAKELLTELACNRI